MMKNSKAWLGAASLPSATLARETAPWHVDALDGWRGMAIVCVLLSHFVGETHIVLGRMGVDFFFVLSGLLMANLLFVRKTELGLFYWRRFSRIAPAFFLYVLCVFVGAWAWGLVVPWNELLPNLLFLRSYLPAIPDYWNSSLPVQHLWSLNVEEHCYIVMGLLTVLPWVKNRGAWVALCGLGLLSLWLRLYAPQMPWLLGEKMAGIRTDTAAAHLMLSAGYWLIKSRFAPWVHPWMPPLALFVGVLCYSDMVPWWFGMLASPFLLAFAVNHLDQSAAAMKAVLCWKPLRQLGIWSFSLYLWQQPFYHWGTALMPWGLALAGAFVVGLISFYWVEQPARNWLNARWDQGLIRSLNSLALRAGKS